MDAKEQKELIEKLSRLDMATLGGKRVPLPIATHMICKMRCLFCLSYQDDKTKIHQLEMTGDIDYSNTIRVWLYCDKCKDEAIKTRELWHHTQFWNTYLRPLCMKFDEKTSTWIPLPRVERTQLAIRRSNGTIETDWIIDSDEHPNCVLKASDRFRILDDDALDDEDPDYDVYSDLPVLSKEHDRHYKIYMYKAGTNLQREFMLNELLQLNPQILNVNASVTATKSS